VRNADTSSDIALPRLIIQHSDPSVVRIAVAMHFAAVRLLCGLQRIVYGTLADHGRERTGRADYGPYSGARHSKLYKIVRAIFSTVQVTSAGSGFEPA
jgi:hypothetical protein